MHVIFNLLALVCSLGAFVCAILILIDAFQDAIWKGFAGLLCGIYLLYYALAEFDHPKKSQILLAWLLCIAGSIVFRVVLG